MQLREALAEFPKRWRIHWFTCLVITVLSVIPLWFFENSALFRMLDHAGSDAVVRAYVPSAKELVGTPERVVLVDFGSKPELALVVETLEKLKDVQPKALGLDFLVVEDPEHDAPLPALVKAMGAGPPIAMPIINEQLEAAAERLPKDKVREASVHLVLDEDGVVRTTYQQVCAVSHDGHVTLPTLAAAMVQGGPSHKTPACHQNDEAQPILFAPVRVQPPFDRSGVYLISTQTLAEHPEILTGAYVILGDVGSGPRADFFTTPVGLRPGALIQAEAVWTRATEAYRGHLLEWLPRWLFAYAIDIFIGSVAGAFFAVFLAASVKWTEGPISSLPMALCRFGLGVAALLWIAGVLFGVGAFCTWFAATFLIQSGVVVGAGVAVFAAMLELLVHGGECLVGPIQWGVTRLCGTSSS